MVPMNTNIGQMILEDAQASHLRVLKASEVSTQYLAFFHWLLPVHFPTTNFDEAIKQACSKGGGSRSYRDVAVLGFLSDRVSELNMHGQRDSLVTWLLGTRVRSSGEYDPIVDDPVGALGVLLAVGASGGELLVKGRVWLAEVCSAAVAGAVKQSSASTFRCVSSFLSGSEATGEISPDVAVALQSKGLRNIDPGIYASAFPSAKLPADEGDLFTAAMRLAALDWIQGQTGISIERPDAGQVRKVLEGAQSSLYRWVWEDKPKTSKRGAEARKWYIENEYHFQSLLYAILRPIFPDLKEEEYTVSVGTTQPRADLYIPSLKLVIEVKYWRGGSNSRDLINELAADASLYRAKGSEIQKVIPVIWDDGRRTEQQSVIQDGVGVIDGLSEAIFVNRPSTWV